jgi:hypothetical protein
MKHNIAKQRHGSFLIALLDANAGDEIIYSCGPYGTGPHMSAAREAAQQGLVMLYQRRIGEGLYDYIAKRTKTEFGG